MHNRYGSQASEDDWVCAAAGLAAVFYRRPDMKLPDDFYVTFFPGTECRDVPGAAGYRQWDQEWHIGLAIESLRASIPLDTFDLMPHEAGHLFDALDGASDGLLSGLSSQERRRWVDGLGIEMRRSATGDSLLRQYAATSPP
jgi:hypothetical protein